MIHAASPEVLPNAVRSSPVASGVPAGGAAVSNREPGGFSGGCVGSLILSGLCLIAAFSTPGYLIGAIAFGAYGYHLYTGGRDFTGEMADGRRRARAWIGWSVFALVAISIGVSYPAAFVIAVPAALYAMYLFAGGRDVTREAYDGTPRSVVWLYYAIISVVGLIVGFSHPGGFLVAIAAGGYSFYVYQGGRWILWIW